MKIDKFVEDYSFLLKNKDYEVYVYNEVQEDGSIKGMGYGTYEEAVKYAFSKGVTKPNIEYYSPSLNAIGFLEVMGVTSNEVALKFVKLLKHFGYVNFEDLKDDPKRTTYSMEEKKAILKEWKVVEDKGGVKKTEFARKKGIDYQTFYKWTKEIDY
ncbi:hypothetical protein [Echinicola sp. 20G]|uniref:hypothetical protein n=1 Tax=Echinicola sp. 20G TaxID=2781961 RepID=UPI00190FCFD7|nr:hypothetical protein [Echinicola sp. 20G]